MVDIVHPPSLMELLQWINSLLALAVTSLRQLHNGAVYCQIVEAHEERAGVSMHRVKWDAHRGFDTLTNYKILQAALEQIRFNGPVLVDRLISGNMSSHMEFLQCLGAWFRQRTERIGYDPVGARQGPMPPWARNVDQMWVSSTGSPNESPEKRTLADSMIRGAAEAKETHCPSASRRHRSGPPSLARSGRRSEPSLAQAAEATRQRLAEMENAALWLWRGQVADSLSGRCDASSASTAGTDTADRSTASSLKGRISRSGVTEVQAMRRALESARCSVTQAQSLKLDNALDANSRRQRHASSSPAVVSHNQSDGSRVAPGKLPQPSSQSFSSCAVTPMRRTKLRTPSIIPSRVASRGSSVERSASPVPDSRIFSGLRIPPPPKGASSFGQSSQVGGRAVFFSDCQSPEPPLYIPGAQLQDFKSPESLEQQGTLASVLPVSDCVAASNSKTIGNLIEALLGEGAVQLAENDQRLASLSAQSDRLEVAVRELKEMLGQTATAA